MVGDADKSAPQKSPLAIPEWFPEQLRSSARILHSRVLNRNQDGAANVVKGLITDPRMKVVWIELQKRRRLRQGNNKELLHPPLIGGLPITEGDIDVQQRAMEELLWFASHAAQRPQLLQPFPSYAEQATQLRADAERLRSAHPSSKGRRLISRLAKAAEAYAELEELRLESSERAVVTDIAEFMRDRFGSPMHGLTATIASVVLGRKISQVKAREWFSRRARKKTKQTMRKSTAKTPRSP